MRKTFPLAIEGKNRDRVLEAVKNEVRKYVRRERRRALPDGVDFWDFDCRFGATEAEAVVVHFATLTELMDTVAKAGGNQFFVEILASHGRRQQRPASQTQD
jgi:predicted N-acyltransferase